jgi:hypothetical protein
MFENEFHFRAMPLPLLSADLPFASICISNHGEVTDCPLTPYFPNIEVYTLIIYRSGNPCRNCIIASLTPSRFCSGNDEYLYPAAYKISVNKRTSFYPCPLLCFSEPLSLCVTLSFLQGVIVGADVRTTAAVYHNLTSQRHFSMGHRRGGAVLPGDPSPDHY